MDRYHVVLWHGENGSIAYVQDRVNPDNCKGLYSTSRYGGRFKEKADKHARELNRETFTVTPA